MNVGRIDMTKEIARRLKMMLRVSGQVVNAACAAQCTRSTVIEAATGHDVLSTNAAVYSTMPHTESPDDTRSEYTLALTVSQRPLIKLSMLGWAVC